MNHEQRRKNGRTEQLSTPGLWDKTKKKCSPPHGYWHRWVPWILAAGGRCSWAWASSAGPRTRPRRPRRPCSSSRTPAGAAGCSAAAAAAVAWGAGAVAASETRCFQTTAETQSRENQSHLTQITQAIVIAIGANYIDNNNLN